MEGRRGRSDRVAVGRRYLLVVLQKAADDGTRRRGERRRRVQMADDGDGKSFHSVLNGCEQSISVFLIRFLSRLKVFFECVNPPGA